MACFGIIIVTEYLVLIIGLLCFIFTSSEYSEKT